MFCSSTRYGNTCNNLTDFDALDFWDVLLMLLFTKIHTPDSSRFWLAASYESRHKQALEPENIDKEFIRLWYKDNCDPYNDAELPEAPKALVAELSRRYITLYETITGSSFVPASPEQYDMDEMARDINKHL